MSDASHAWLSDLAALRESEIPCVLITVVTAKGSTPREAGTKMVVTGQEQFGTIGGGNLEFEAVAAARELLQNAAENPELKNYSLGPALAQCCGGAVTVLLEPFFSAAKTLLVFGAGHVGKEVVKILDGMAVKIKWIDERAAEFPKDIPANAEKIVSATPVDILKKCCSNSYILVITHSHDLDYTLVEAALEKNDFAYLGLIGSDTKRAKFEKRLKAAGIPKDRLERLVCPIGIDGITGKHPREIAISVAAELLQKNMTQGAAKK